MWHPRTAKICPRHIVEREVLLLGDPRSIGVAVEHDKEKVFLIFNHPVTATVLDPDFAMHLGNELIRAAKQVGK